VIVTEEQIRDEVLDAIKQHRVMLFMKGVPEAPRCGFSMQVVQILDAVGTEYAAMDILPDPRIRQVLSAESGWPTIPQLFVDGELVGGSDIVMEMFESGELAELLGVDQPELEETAEPEQPVQQRPIGLENRLN
jgi:monothiol glutaredoxin